MPPPKKEKVRPRAAERRSALRDSLWPGSANEIWDRRENDGFGTIPRLLPLILVLIKTLARQKFGGRAGDPGATYLDLWARNFDEGIVQITDEEAFAYSAGFTGSRAVRSWRERIEALRELGFIKTAPMGNRDVGAILLVNPILRCKELRAAGEVTEQWWNAFEQRAGEIGVEVAD